MKFSLIFIVFIISALPLKAQGYLGFTLSNLQSRQSESFRKSSTYTSAAFETGCSFDYIFHRKKQNNGQAYSIYSQMGMSTSNGANGLQYSHARVPVLVLTHTPQLGFKDQVFFDAYLGAGYFLDFPLASNYSADEHSLDFIGHGIACKIGMSFYTALNGRFDIALLNTTAIGSIKQKNYPNYLTPPSFHTYGIQFSFHANLKSVLRKRKKNK